MMKVTSMNLKINIIVFTLLFTGFILQDNKGVKLVKKIQEKYKSYDNIRVEFVQKTYSEFETDTTVTYGTIYIKGENFLRLETEYETIATNGEVIYTLNHTNKQLLIENADKEDEDIFFPRKILFHFPEEYEINYEGKCESVEENIIELCFISMKIDNIISEFQIWIEEESLSIIKVKTVDLNENVSIYILKDASFNLDIQKDIFKIEEKEAEEVVDMRRD